MTIDEMRALKTDTEKQISSLLMSFHEKTGLFITDPGIRVDILSSYGKNRYMAITTDMQVSL